MEVCEAVKSKNELLTLIRRDLHQIPEESGKEFLTQAYICNFLNQRNIPHRKIATGVVCDFLGVSRQKTIALRADIDALPIIEKTPVPYKSSNGFMHACGHDGHAAILLTVCDILSESQPPVTVRCIFQFGEEGQAGAATMIAGGVLDGVSEIYALHTDPGLDAGKFATRSGVMMAGAEELTFRFFGKGAHCAEPWNGVDALKPVLIFLDGVRTIQAAQEGNKQRVLLHVGKIIGGTARNVIADQAQINATLRYFDERDRKRIMNELTELLRLTDQQGTTHTLTVDASYPPLCNDESAVVRVKALLPDVLEAPVRFTAEDFAFYLQKVPGCLVWLGTKTEKFSAPLHSDLFGFDEKALSGGAMLFLKLIDSHV